MTRPRYYKTEAIVLRQMPIGEADRILTLATPGLGKLRTVARGVRRPRSHLAGHVEPLTRVLLSIARGRTLDVVTGAQSLDGHRQLREDLDLASRAIYCAELVDAFAPQDQPASAIYYLLRDALGWLGSLGPPALLLRYFELRLLEASGFVPELYRCVLCRTDVSPGGHAFSPASGGVLCPRCYQVQGSVMPLSLPSLKVLRFLHRQEYSAVAQLRLPPEVDAELEHLLGAYIQHTLEREVKSARFLEHLRQLQETSPAG